MVDTISRWLFDPSGLTPHGFCLLWEPGLLWLHAVSDLGIGLAYFTIPAALAVFARQRRDLVFRPIFWLFAAFILLCGTGHFFEVVTLWVPLYGLEGLIKAATALVSIVTAVALWHMLPHALALPSPAQLRQANVALLESEARYRASFEYAPVPSYLLDGNGIIIGVSNSWLALLGYASVEVVGRHVDAIAAPGQLLWQASDLSVLTATGEIRDAERRFRRADGGTVDALVSSRLERHGDATLIVCVLIDITARREAEQALQASEEKLRQAQKMEAVGRLTGGVAHDFNNMLQGILGGIELTERRIEQGRPEDAAQYVALARQTVGRAAALTQRMLAFARRQSLNPRPVDTNALVRGMAELIRRTAGPAVRVELRLDRAARPAQCDANQLESALLNLAINARDAMPEGGTLTIATLERHLSQADLIDQDGARPGDYVEISVADTGTGMTPDVMARAFEPFFTTKPVGQGSGLGLSQIYGFVRQSDGLARIESAPYQGTTVRFYIPLAAPGAQPGAAGPSGTDAALAAAPGSAGAIAGTVLVVDDDPVIRAQIAEALRDRGCAVLEAEDGPAALRLVQSRARIDMLISDVGLPGMNGRQLAEASREARPGLPVLLITGYAGTALEDMALPDGTLVIAKPFELGKLAAQVHAMLETPLVR